jgi:prepilin-type N-terminal cleavage/methylation domain-containing protein
MKTYHAKPAPRTGFTLVELLVVIALIAVLVSLLVAASVNVLRRVDETRAHNDMDQLQTACNTFKQQFKVPYIPSRIRLYEDLNYNLADPLDADSYAYLKRLFPKMQLPVYWSGNFGGQPQHFELEGDQCLVFFLGGIPTYGPNSCQGFSTNPTNPALPGGDRINGGPFFQFPSNRLFSRPVVSPSKLTSGAFFSFQDTFGKNLATSFYAYFSSYKAANGYNRYFDYYMALVNAPISDCNSLGVWPYAAALGGLPRYQNPETFQIICAGPDGLFGTGSAITSSPTFGGTWSGGPLWDSSAPNVSQFGQDDLSNFSPSRLITGG